MFKRLLAQTGPNVSAISLGLMGMSDFYANADRDESLATIDTAVDAGVTMLDTGDLYGSGHNELLLAEALKRHRRDDLTIAVKFGVMRDPAGGFLGVDNRPAALKNALAMTLRRLGTDHVDIYMPARLDPAVPIEDTVGAIKDMIDAGYVRHLGLSEVGADTLRAAHAVHPVAALQIEYSIASRGIEDAILPTARELGVGVTAYGVLSRGLLSGHWKAGQAVAGGGDFRAHLPRFMGENLTHNLALVEALRAIAEAKGIPVAALAIAWVMAKGNDIVALVGARTPARLAEALGALDVSLSADDLAAIERAFPRDAVAGTRYGAGQMAMLDSERA